MVKKTVKVPKNIGKGPHKLRWTDDIEAGILSYLTPGQQPLEGPGGFESYAAVGSKAADQASSFGGSMGRVGASIGSTFSGGSGTGSSGGSGGTGSAGNTARTGYATNITAAQRMGYGTVNPAVRAAALAAYTAAQRTAAAKAAATRTTNFTSANPAANAGTTKAADVARMTGIANSPATRSIASASLAGGGSSRPAPAPTQARPAPPPPPPPPKIPVPVPRPPVPVKPPPVPPAPAFKPLPNLRAINDLAPPAYPPSMATYATRLATPGATSVSVPQTSYVPSRSTTAPAPTRDPGVAGVPGGVSGRGTTGSLGSVGSMATRGGVSSSLGSNGGGSQGMAATQAAQSNAAAARGTSPGGAITEGSYTPQGAGGAGSQSVTMPSRPQASVSNRGLLSGTMADALRAAGSWTPPAPGATAPPANLPSYQSFGGLLTGPASAPAPTISRNAFDTGRATATVRANPYDVRQSPVPNTGAKSSLGAPPQFGPRMPGGQMLSSQNLGAMGQTNPANFTYPGAGQPSAVAPPTGPRAPRDFIGLSQMTSPQGQQAAQQFGPLNDALRGGTTMWQAAPDLMRPGGPVMGGAPSTNVIDLTNPPQVQRGGKMNLGSPVPTYDPLDSIGTPPANSRMYMSGTLPQPRAPGWVGMQNPNNVRVTPDFYSTQPPPAPEYYPNERPVGLQQGRAYAGQRPIANPQAVFGGSGRGYGALGMGGLKPSFPGTGGLFRNPDQFRLR